MFVDEATASFIYYGLNVHAWTCAQPSTLHCRVLLTVLIHWLVWASRPYIKAMAALHLQRLLINHKTRCLEEAFCRPPSTFHYSCSTRALPIFDGRFVISAKWKRRHQSNMKIAHLMYIKKIQSTCFVHTQLSAHNCVLAWGYVVYKSKNAKENFVSEIKNM